MKENNEISKLRFIVGERISELRRKEGLSQAELANDIGITQASISNYEDGRRDIPASVIYKLSKRFEVSTDYLFGYQEIPDQANANSFIDDLRLCGFSDSGVSGILENIDSLEFIDFMISHKSFRQIIKLVGKRYTYRELFSRGYRAFLISNYLYTIVNEYLSGRADDPIDDDLRQLTQDELQELSDDIDYVFNNIRDRQRAFLRLWNSDDSDEGFDADFENLYSGDLDKFELKMIKSKITEMINAKNRK